MGGKIYDVVCMSIHTTCGINAHLYHIVRNVCLCSSHRTELGLVGIILYWDPLPLAANGWALYILAHMHLKAFTAPATICRSRMSHTHTHAP